MTSTTPSKVRNTILMLQACSRAKREVRLPLSLTQDVGWLVNMGINRRAGWPDDPSGWRGSCMPVNEAGAVC